MARSKSKHKLKRFRIQQRWKRRKVKEKLRRKEAASER